MKLCHTTKLHENAICDPTSHGPKYCTALMKKEMSIIEVVKGTRVSYQLSESVEEITWQ